MDTSLSLLLREICSEYDCPESEAAPVLKK
jgi:hypothetical protein